jgi:hypothetical protein
MAWAGWGAGPAGAGASGGPSRWFLAASMVGAAIVTGILAVQHRWAFAAVGAVATVYFVARLFFGLGRRQ